MNKEPENENPNNPIINDGNSSNEQNGSTEKIEIVNNKITIEGIDVVTSFNPIKTNYEGAIKELNKTPENNCEISNNSIKYQNMLIDKNDIEGTPLKCEMLLMFDDQYFYILTQEGSLYEVTTVFNEELEVESINKLELNNKVSNFNIFQYGQDGFAPRNRILIKLSNGKIVNEDAKEIEKNDVYYAVSFIDFMSDKTIRRCIKNTESDSTCLYKYDNNIKVKEIFISANDFAYILDESNYLYKIDHDKDLEKISDKKIVSTTGYKIDSNSLHGELLDNHIITFVTEN